MDHQRGGLRLARRAGRALVPARAGEAPLVLVSAAWPLALHCSNRAATTQPFGLLPCPTVSRDLQACDGKKKVDPLRCSQKDASVIISDALSRVASEVASRAAQAETCAAAGHHLGRRRIECHPRRVSRSPLRSISVIRVLPGTPKPPQEPVVPHPLASHSSSRPPQPNGKRPAGGSLSRSRNSAAVGPRCQRAWPPALHPGACAAPCTSLGGGGMGAAPATPGGGLAAPATWPLGRPRLHFHRRPRMYSSRAADEYFGVARDERGAPPPPPPSPGMARRQRATSVACRRSRRHAAAAARRGRGAQRRPPLAC